MKQTLAIISLIGFLVACAGSGAILAPTTAPALQGITGVDALMGAPCATNFYRLAPHECQANVALTNFDLKNFLDNTCRAMDMNVAYGIPTSSTLVRVLWTGNAALAPANSMNTLYFDASCTIPIDRLSLNIATAFQDKHDNVPMQGGKIFIKSDLNLVASCIAATTCLFRPVGYFD